MSEPAEKYEETYYEILKVDRKATISEIVQAYHSAKGAFSKDSLATYSLFSPEEAKVELQKLEEAYHNLSNIDKKRDYDRFLAERAGTLPPTQISERQKTRHAQAFTRESKPAETTSPAGTEEVRVISETSTPAPAPDSVTGAFLKETREKRGLSLDDVARITKIHPKFLRAIEEDIRKELPARVYIQGFVRNLATLYKLEPQSTSKHFIQSLDRASGK